MVAPGGGHSSDVVAAKRRSDNVMPSWRFLMKLLVCGGDHWFADDFEELVIQFKGVFFPDLMKSY